MVQFHYARRAGAGRKKIRHPGAGGVGESVRQSAGVEWGIGAAVGHDAESATGGCSSCESLRSACVRFDGRDEKTVALLLLQQMSVDQVSRIVLRGTMLKLIK